MTTSLLTEQPPPFPARSEERLEAAIRRLRTREWTRLEGAPETEAALREFHGGGEVWYVASGTAALEAILLGHGIGPGDHVITTAYTWGATVAAILAVGAVPLFADILPEAPLLDPASVEKAVTPRTKAILAVHLFGFPCDMPALRAVADRHGLCLFEDGSQAHGARLHGKRVGAFGDAAAFSCMGLKPLAGTEGGYCIFQDPEAAERAYLHGKHPRGLSPARAEALQEAGCLDALQLGWRPCAVGAELVRSGLATLDTENAARRENARLLREGLANHPAVYLDQEPEHGDAIHHLLSIRLRKAGCAADIQSALCKMAEAGLHGFHYIPVPLHQLPRMDWRHFKGPKPFWHSQLRGAGIEYAKISLPRTEARTRGSFELAWNWIEPNPRAMQQICDCLNKL